MSSSVEHPLPRLAVHQPTRGFRYGSEAFWLAGLALEEPVGSAVDLGTGSGIVACLLAACGVRALGIDLHPSWPPLWERTLAESRTVGPLELRAADLRGEIGGTFDVALANPPFFVPGTGPMPADPWSASARFELAGGVADFVLAGTRLAPRGRVIVVTPVAREPDLRAAVPAGWSVRRTLRVGQRRVIFLLRPGDGPDEQVVVAPGGEVEEGWYATVRRAAASAACAERAVGTVSDPNATVREPSETSEH